MLGLVANGDSVGAGCESCDKAAALVMVQKAWNVFVSCPLFLLFIGKVAAFPNSGVENFRI